MILRSILYETITITVDSDLVYLSDAVFTTAPAGVDQPGTSIVLFHLVSEHFGIHGRMKWQEGFTEASREGHLWLFDTDFSTSDFSSVSRDKVIHCLFVTKLRDWRKNTESVASQENDILWMTSESRDFSAWDKIKRVGDTSVFCD